MFLFLILQYGTEAWTLKIDVFEMRTLQKILRILWMVKHTNITILHQLHKKQ